MKLYPTKMPKANSVIAAAADRDETMKTWDVPATMKFSVLFLHIKLHFKALYVAAWQTRNVVTRNLPNSTLFFFFFVASKLPVTLAHRKQELFVS